MTSVSRGGGNAADARPLGGWCINIMVNTSFKQAFSHVKEKRTLSLILSVTVFVVCIYLIRGGGDEFSLFLESLSMLVVFFCVVSIPIVGFVVFMAGRLIYKVIRHGFEKNGSFIPLILLISGTFLAVILPLPPLAEEASFNTHREDYEYIVALAKANQLGHGNGCNANTPSFYAYKIPDGYEHLSEDCVFVLYYSGNINVEFSPYDYAVALNYFENPSDVTRSRDCDFRGHIWKRINENWYVCKLSHTW